MTDELFEKLELPQSVQDTLQTLSDPVDLDSLDYFTTELASYWEELRTRLDYNELVDIGLVEKIYESILDLLHMYPDRSEEEQRLIISAVRYFVIDEEEEADPEHPWSFEMDAKVLDEVHNSLGLKAPKILS